MTCKHCGHHWEPSLGFARLRRCPKCWLYPWIPKVRPPLDVTQK